MSRSSSDGATLAAGSYAGIHLWNTNTSNPQKTPLTYNVHSIAFSPDEDTLVSGFYDGAIGLWDTATGQEQNRIKGHTDSDSDHREIASLAYSIDGTMFASGSWDNTIRLWDANTGAHLKTLVGHGSLVNSLAFSPDGKTLASGSQERNYPSLEYCDRDTLEDV